MPGTVFRLAVRCTAGDWGREVGSWEEQVKLGMRVASCVLGSLGYRQLRWLRNIWESMGEDSNVFHGGQTNCSESDVTAGVLGIHSNDIVKFRARNPASQQLLSALSGVCGNKGFSVPHPAPPEDCHWAALSWGE